MLSLPDFDPNLSLPPETKAQFNFATKGLYEPGSVLKVFNAALALESGEIKLTDRFDATKPLKLKYNTIRDYLGKNRWLDLEEIMIYSSNIGSAQIALKIGQNKKKSFQRRKMLKVTLKIIQQQHQNLTNYCINTTLLKMMNLRNCC